MDKTNVMRILEQKKIDYKSYEYDQNITDGVSVANILNENPNKVFKTLVTSYATGKYAVFVIPVNASLDTKKAAKVINEKYVEMIKQKELLPLTGYIHGGCSPIGMKKLFMTIIDISALNYETIYVSGGKVGVQVEINPNNLAKLVNAKFENLI
jgi:Cys-tRNA(Pro)/Cys-tRNA(Cys) deacylase